MTTTAKPAPARTPRRIEHLKSYGPLLRIVDRLAGRRDQRLIPTDTAGPQTVNTPYTARLQATFDEIDRQTFARIQDECRVPATRLRELVDDMSRIDVLITDIQSALANLPSQPSPDELGARNGGELHLSEHAVATRRSREHAAGVARARAALTELQNQRSSHLAECARSAAALTEAFELARSTSERLRHFYNRRVSTYARHASIAAEATPTIAAPQWTEQPCPWVPAGYWRYVLAAQQSPVASGQ